MSETAGPPPDAKGRFHFLIVPESAEESTVPIWRTSSDATTFLRELYDQLIATRSGWCYLIVDGQRAHIHPPEQSFRVTFPDGAEHVATSGGKPTLSQDGRFKILEPAR